MHWLRHSSEDRLLDRPADEMTNQMSPQASAACLPQFAQFHPPTVSFAVSHTHNRSATWHVGGAHFQVIIHEPCFVNPPTASRRAGSLFSG